MVRALLLLFVFSLPIAAQNKAASDAKIRFAAFSDLARCLCEISFLSLQSHRSRQINTTP